MKLTYFKTNQYYISSCCVMINNDLRCNKPTSIFCISGSYINGNSNGGAGISGYCNEHGKANISSNKREITKCAINRLILEEQTSLLRMQEILEKDKEFMKTNVSHN